MYTFSSLQTECVNSSVSDTAASACRVSESCERDFCCGVDWGVGESCERDIVDRGINDKIRMYAAL